MVFNDSDIKIAGDKPSLDVKRNKTNPKNDGSYSIDKDKARLWGEAVAHEFIKDAQNNPLNDECDYEMTVQRRFLLSFTATVGFEQFSSDDAFCGVAQKGFLDVIKKEEPSLYDTAQDTGAFSFYYLAFRRGGDTVRRIGQTFAMLCSHDGDPVYQELGEALYCWFLSVIKDLI
ncbi:MAG: hypothetical protein IKT44_00290 [Clostridia bacterium]|nr:hypothetical protein [Clostridia bacterium]